MQPTVVVSVFVRFRAFSRFAVCTTYGRTNTIRYELVLWAVLSGDEYYRIKEYVDDLKFLAPSISPIIDKLHETVPEVMQFKTVPLY
jgi:hypothetical protein